MNGLKYKRKIVRKNRNKRMAISKNPTSGLSYMYIESYDVIASILGTTSYQFNSTGVNFLNFSDIFNYAGSTSTTALFKNWQQIKIVSLDVLVTDAIDSPIYNTGTFGDSSFPTYVLACYPQRQSYDAGSYTVFNDQAVYITPGLKRTTYKRFKFNAADRMTGTAQAGKWVDMASTGTYSDIKGELHVKTAHGHNTPATVHVSNVRSRFLIALRMPS